MQLNIIDLATLKPRKLFVATPMYGGQCFAGYLNSMMRLQGKMMQNGLSLTYFSMANESQINRARNYCTYQFLMTDCTHLLFIDADIDYSADDALSILAASDPKSDKDVIAGIYPKKVINWDRIERAVHAGVHGMDLAEQGANMAFSPVLDGSQMGSFSLYELLEVPETATGFMLIQRHVFDKLAEAYPDRWYASDGKERSDKKPGRIPHFFENHVEANGRYMTEDFNFCRMVREIGMKVWVAPWLQLNHQGFYKFLGNPQAITEPATCETAAEAA